MTIAAGFVCDDGIVIAADAKESYGDTHTYVDKIVQIQGDGVAGTITGSGDGYILDYICGEIRTLIDGQPYAIEDFEIRLRTLLADIYSGKALKAYPIEKPQDLWIQLLVSYSTRSVRPALFLINSSLVTRVQRSAVVIGCGPLRQLAEEIGSERMNSHIEAPLAALYVVHEAKRRYSDVGGITRIVIHQEEWIIEDRLEDQPAREALFDATRGLMQRLTLAIINPHPWRFEEVLRSFPKEAREIHKMAERLERVFTTRQGAFIGVRPIAKRPRRSTSRKSKRGK